MAREFVSSDAVRAPQIRAILMEIRDLREIWRGLTAQERGRVPGALRDGLQSLMTVVQTEGPHLGDATRNPIFEEPGVGQDIHAGLMGTQPEVGSGFRILDTPLPAVPGEIGGDKVIREEDQKGYTEPGMETPDPGATPDEPLAR